MCCPNLRCSAGFQPALSRQDGGATSKSKPHRRVVPWECGASKPLVACLLVDNILQRLTLQKPLQVLQEEFHVQLVEAGSVIGAMRR